MMTLSAAPLLEAASGTSAWCRLTTASIIGRGHSALRRNGQDAVATRARGDSVAFVVADGCGSGRASELGALLGAETFAETVSRALADGATPEDALLDAVSRVVALLDVVASHAATGEARASFVLDHLLATVLAVAITPACGALLVAGAGLAMLDDDVRVFDADNAPRYLAYGVLGRPLEAFSIHSFGAIERAAIATDGFDAATLDEAVRTGVADSSATLTRRLRSMQRSGAFDDDASIAIWTRTLPRGV